MKVFITELIIRAKKREKDKKEQYQKQVKWLINYEPHHWVLCIEKYGFTDHIENANTSFIIVSLYNMHMVGKQNNKLIQKYWDCFATEISFISFPSPLAFFVIVMISWFFGKESLIFYHS